MKLMTMDDLAVFGNTPAFQEKLHIGRPNIGDRTRLLARINNVLDNKWLTNNGPYVKELEERMADMLGVKHCIAICNGTVALEIAIKALDLWGEVIIPSMTFIATAHALQWQAITPIFCDVDPKSHNIDPLRVEEMITPLTTGIIGVHLWGRPCNVEALAEIAERHNLKLLYDAAHAFGCSYKGNMIGKFGEAEVFSFHATKFFNTFEGGAIATNNDNLAEKIRLMRNFGFAGHDNVIYLGTNGKMSEMSAAMGLTLLESLDDLIAVNYCNYKQYQQALEEIPGIRLVPYDEAETCNYQYIAVEIEEEVTQVNRNQLIEILQAENVLARRYFYPGCHRMEPYRSHFPDAGTVLPETEKILDRILCLPTGTAIGPNDVNKISQIIETVVSHGVAVKERLHVQKQYLTLPAPHLSISLDQNLVD